jgi:hypothetical protein
MAKPSLKRNIHLVAIRRKKLMRNQELLSFKNRVELKLVMYSQNVAA